MQQLTDQDNLADMPVSRYCPMSWYWIWNGSAGPEVKTDLRSTIDGSKERVERETPGHPPKADNMPAPERILMRWETKVTRIEKELMLIVGWCHDWVNGWLIDHMLHTKAWTSPTLSYKWNHENWASSTKTLGHSHGQLETDIELLQLSCQLWPECKRGTPPFAPLFPQTCRLDRNVK